MKRCEWKVHTLVLREAVLKVFYSCALYYQDGFIKGVQKYEADIEAMRHFVESSERHSTLAMQNARQHEV